VRLSADPRSRRPVLRQGPTPDGLPAASGPSRRPQAVPRGRRAKRPLTLAGLLLVAHAAQGCASVGPTRLGRDQLDYTRTLSEAGKRQTLFNLIRMRYGEPPAFLSVSQVVSGYTLQGNAQAGLNAYPSASASNFASLLGGAQYTDRPTFTLSPVSGEHFVQAYLRPFAPADIVPLVEGGTPVDVLFRLVARSVGPLQNTHPLGGPDRSGSPDFLPLLGALRTLQEAGVLRVRLRREKGAARVFVTFETRHAPSMRGVVSRVGRLLGIDPSSREVEVVYGTDRGQIRSREIPVLTRSLLNVLFAVAAEIQVPDEDVRAGRTNVTLREPGDPRPSIVVRTGASEPAASYASVRVDDRWYWVEGEDFESKKAFTILEILKSIAEGARGAAPPVLTIPAG
jgi:hypothetical protein